MSVAHTAGISPRHLSFIETGKANASRKTLIYIADALDLGPHDRNTLMLAAGYAPPHPRTDWADPTGYDRLIRPRRDGLIRPHVRHAGVMTV